MTEQHDLKVERRQQHDATVRLETEHGASVMLTPPVEESYWSYRVRLTERQSVLAFPKFGMFAIGFAVEQDWNTNLPASMSAEEIAAHIMHNKGDEAISDESVVAAVRAIQQAIATDEGGR